MSRSLSLAITFGLTALIATPTSAQQQNNAGLGTIKRGFDATNAVPTRDPVLAGVAFLNGMTYVSGVGGNPPPAIYVFDSSGTNTRQFNAPATVGNLSNDGFNLIGANSGGVYVFDKTGTPVNQLMAASGAQVITTPIPIAGARAIAFDSNGNSGMGSLFAGNLGVGAPIFEYDLGGNLMNTFPNGGWDCTGLAVDPKTGNLWCMNSPGVADVIELDRANNLVPTGQSFLQANPSLTFQGDLDIVPGGDPRAGTYKSEVDIVVLDRLNGPDRIYYHRLHLYPGRNGTHEPILEGGVNGPANTIGDLGPITAGQTLSWQLSTNGDPTSTGLPAAVFFNIGNDASIDGITNLPFPAMPVFPEFRILWPLSVPASLQNISIPSVVGGGTLSVVLPAGVLSCVHNLRLQAMVLDPRVPIFPPLLATNEIFTYVLDEPSCDIIVEAVGADSFNNITTSGFWRVIHSGGPAIEEIEFDWHASTHPLQGDMRFDTDNPTMADFFDAGNSAIAACSGTYRNGSDARTGLVYDGLNNPANACDPAANTGWIGTIEGTNPRDWRVLKFRFTNFNGGTIANPVVFEFDCDTDGGLGVSGGLMEGCVIRIKLQGNIRIASELRVDLNAPNRSFAGF